MAPSEDQATASFDVGRLTLADIEDIEAYVGQPFQEVAEALQEGRLTAKMMTAVAWIAQRATDPSFTLEQARGLRAVELEGLMSSNGGGADPPGEGAPSDGG